MTAKQIIEQYEKLKSERYPYDNLWQEIADYMLPNKADFNRLYGLGQNRRQHIFDTTAPHSLGIFASSIMGFLANPASRWFTIETMDEEINDNDVAAEWLDDAGQQMLNAFNDPKAKFYGSLFTTLMEIGAFGNGSMIVMPGQQSLVSFKSQPINGAYIMENSEGNVDTIYRCIPMTLNQLNDKAVREDWKVPEDILKHLNKEPNREYDVIHRIKPRLEKKAELGSKAMPFESVYVLVDKQVVLSEKGFEENPIAYARWAKAGTEQYGRGPGHEALADVKMVNAMQRANMVRAEKELNPPLQAPEDHNHQIDLSAGAINLYDPQMGEIKPIVDRLDVGFHAEVLTQTQDAIRRAFFNDQLQLVGGPDMTATEVLQRQDEKARLLAPSIGMIQAELIGPVVERTFAVMSRLGVFTEVPDILQGKEIKVTYVSPLSRAQRAGEAMAMLQYLETVIGLSQAFPEARHRIDIDASIKELREVSGVSPKTIVDDDEYKARLEAEQKRADAAQTLQAADMAAGAAEKANKAGII